MGRVGFVGGRGLGNGVFVEGIFRGLGLEGVLYRWFEFVLRVSRGRLGFFDLFLFFRFSYSYVYFYLLFVVLGLFRSGFRV